MSINVAVIGAGSWATALAVLLAGKGLGVSMWSRSLEQIRDIKAAGQNEKYLPGVPFPQQINLSGDLEYVLKDVRAVLFGVPSHAFRATVGSCLPFLKEETLIVNAAKGIEEDSLKRMSHVFEDVAGRDRLARYVTLSGPSHAEEVGRCIPTTVVMAGNNLESAVAAQDLFMTKSFRVYTNPDIAGVELAGALKNVIALGTGISDGLGFGDNTKAALMTRGLAEITRLGLAMGSNPLTFAGLAGVGDLIATCTSMHSRNRRAGIEIGRGKTLQEAEMSVRMVVEGVRTTKAAYRLSQRYAVDMPITEQTHRVLFEGLSPLTAVTNLMARGKRNEMEEVVLENLRWQL